MRYLPPVLVLLAVFLLLVLFCWGGWRRRARRQREAGLPVPPAPEATTARAAADALDGVYVATTLAGAHLERITAHGLGARSRARITPELSPQGGTSWLIERQGAPDLLIPAGDVHEVTTAPGMVGKWIGGDGLLVVRWSLGGTLLDTGLRLDRRKDHDRLLALGRKDHA